VTILKLLVAGDAWSAQESSVILKTVKNFPNVVCRVCQNCVATLANFLLLVLLSKQLWGNAFWQSAS
jgi:hypothetical protein